MAEREILFRGKRTDCGEWVEGILFNAKEDTFIIPHGNEYSYDPIEGLAFDVYGCKIAPETVGQYTGLTDKNGKMIFEGDIMHNAGNIVEFCGGGFCINGDSPLSYWMGTEIIGNIHDNPELLENSSL